MKTRAKRAPDSAAADNTGNRVWPPQAEVAKPNIVGSYRLIKRLGSGGMGDVYLAEHMQLGRKVALKRLKESRVRDPANVERFFCEAKAISRINHQHIVRVTDFISDGADASFVMELLEGESLAERIEREGATPWPQVLQIAKQLTDALQAVHNLRIVHRDLKPGNIMLTERHGSRNFVKLLDFGVARFTETSKQSAPLTKAGQLLGTPSYMAPELFLRQEADFPSDIYALGAVLYEMLVGKKLVVASNWIELLSQLEEGPPPLPHWIRWTLPSRFRALIYHCLSKEPDARPQSAAAVLAELRAIKRPRRTPLPQYALAVATTAVSIVTAGYGFRSASSELPVNEVTAGAVELRASAKKAVGRLDSVRSGLFEELARSEDKWVPEPTRVFASQPLGMVATSGQPSDNATPDEVSPQREHRSQRHEAAVPASASLRRRLGKKRASMQRPAAATRGAVRRRLTPAASSSGKAVKDTIASRPSATATLYQQGVTLFEQGRVLLAVKTFNKCLASMPRHAEANRMLGRAYASLGYETQAIQAFETFLKLAPNDKNASRLRAVIARYRRR